MIHGDSRGMYNSEKVDENVRGTGENILLLCILLTARTIRTTSLHALSSRFLAAQLPQLMQGKLYTVFKLDESTVS